MIERSLIVLYLSIVRAIRNITSFDMLTLEEKRFRVKHRFFKIQLNPCLVTLLLLTMLGGCASSYKDKSEQRFALVIGNAAYDFDPLKNAGNDAKGMAGKLESLGFKTSVYFDTSVQQLSKAIDAFYAQITSKSAVTVVYYAGHAIQINNTNYLIPVNAKITSLESMATETVSMDHLLNNLRKSKSRTNVIILDACRNNPFSKDGRYSDSFVASEIRNNEGGLANIDAPPGTLIAYATEPGKVAQDGADTNGTYTKHLLRYLDAPVGVEKMFKLVRSGVMRETGNRQIPWEHSSLYKDFHFLKDEASKLPNISSF